jgi:hypothetical protein
VWRHGNSKCTVLGPRSCCLHRLEIDRPQIDCLSQGGLFQVDVGDSFLISIFFLAFCRKYLGKGSYLSLIRFVRFLYGIAAATALSSSSIFQSSIVVAAMSVKSSAIRASLRSYVVQPTPTRNLTPRFLCKYISFCPLYHPLRFPLCVACCYVEESEESEESEEAQAKQTQNTRSPIIVVLSSTTEWHAV